MDPQWKVRSLTAADDSAYQSFLHELSQVSSEVLGYHFPFYRNIMQSCGLGEPYYAGLFTHEKLVAAIPGFIKNGASGSVYCSLPFFGPNAGVMCLDKSISAEAHELLIKHVLDHLKREPNPIAASFYTPFLFNEFARYERALDKFYVVEKYTQYLDIPTTVWSNKINYDLRRAERMGLSITEDISEQKIDALIEIYNQNCRDYKIPPKPAKFIHELGRAALDGKQTDFYFTHHEGSIIGGLIVIYSKSTLSYYLPCSLDSKRTLQPVTYMIDHAFQKARRRGITYWNWESSPSHESGVYKFKRKWGSTDSNYRIYVQPLCDLSKIKSIGKGRISGEFPYFFVFPFDKIE
jgi:hypothetical protein